MSTFPYMKRFSKVAMMLLSLLIGTSQLKAQIFEPEGLNIPGSWNGFTNPPANGSAFGSATQVPAGRVTLITTGTRRYQTGFSCADGGDVVAGDYDFLFTSGPTNGAFNNKWAGVDVVLNTLQNYTYNSGNDNTISLTDNKYYTVNFRDQGYAPSSAVFMETSAEPVQIDSITTDIALANVAANLPVEVTAWFSSEPSPEELFYIRYSVDNFATSQVVPMGVEGTEAVGSIPGFIAGNQISFYVFSTVIEDISADYDMFTLRFLNNEGLNFQYTVLSPDNLVNLGPNIFACEGSGPWVLDAGEGFDSYLWSTGQVSSSITVTQAGDYWVQVIQGSLSDLDTVSIELWENPVVNLGSNITVCASSPITLSSGFLASPQGDTLTIIYDATQGQSTLANLPPGDKVYLHSSYEVSPFTGPVNPWVGNWGQDDGLGEMTSLGNNLWTITIPVYSYYNIPGNNPISGLFMVFRNSDGTRTGKDDAGNDIFLNLQQNPPTSAFDGVSATIQSTGIAAIEWSTGATTPNLLVEGSGTYSVTVTTSNGCSASDEIQVSLLPVPVLSVSDDTSTCGAISNYPISASGNFVSYSWSSGQNTASFLVSQPGTYVVTATAANGCTATDSVRVRTDVASVPLALSEAYTTCGNTAVVLDPGVSVSPQGDSLTIIYDATQGQSGLVGATSVYMHSSFEFAPFSGSVIPWVGNWGQDDGIGQMTPLGNNLWKITINVYDYYNVPADSLVNGLFMVFRNADGTQTGKDDAGNDIFLNLTTDPPSSAFDGVTATLESSPFVAVLWSNGENTPLIEVSEAGTYDVVFFGANGCNIYDTTTVTTLPAPVVNLGADRILCSGSDITLNAGDGFVNYEWSTGDTTSSTTVNEAGAYTVTVFNAGGCEATDVVNVLLINPPVAGFTVLTDGTLTVTFTDQTQGPAVYSWDFDSDGDEDLALNGTVSYTYPSNGDYTATLYVSNLCGSDTFEVDIDLSDVGFNPVSNQVSMKVFPNPASSDFSIQLAEPGNALMNLYDLTGRLVYSEALLSNVTSISRNGLPAGVYGIEIVQNGKIARSRVVFN